MTAILGISAYYHDSAAALVVDGQVVGAGVGSKKSEAEGAAAEAAYATLTGNA